jgi:hypothetical protein
MIMSGVSDPESFENLIDPSFFRGWAHSTA